MIVLVILLLSFIISCAANSLLHGDFQILISGNIAMCCMLWFTAVGHFRFADGMVKMIPPFLPFKKEIVLISGIFEIAAGIALLFIGTRNVTGIILMLFFILILPSNIYAATQKLDYQKGSYDGKGLNYLWFRVPMQVFLIWWVWYFSVR